LAQPRKRSNFNRLCKFGRLTRTSQNICSGVVVAPDTVITTASCIYTPERKAKATTLFISTQPVLDYKMPLAQALLKVASIAKKGIPHPDFDLMIIFLNHRLNVEPALLLSPSEVFQIRLRTHVFLAGYGFRGELQTRSGWRDWWAAEKSISPGEKTVATSQIVEVKTHDLLIGRGPGDGAACLGDEGAPVFAHIDTPYSNSQRVVGIIISDPGQKHCAKPSLALRLDAFRDFIHDTMVQECQNKERSWCQEEGLLTVDYDEEEQQQTKTVPEIITPPLEITPPPLPPLPPLQPIAPPVAKPTKRRLNVSAEGAGCSCQQVSRSR
jgi:hypothetical protein